MGEGRDGDWDCSGCRNRNYAFRSFCNRCKQPRFMVDARTPADSKWLPRAGDWICTGCSNNNYASREMCKKCGQPKEEAAMPAIAMPGAYLPAYAHYFAGAHGLAGSKMNFGITSNSAFQQSPIPNCNWSFGGADRLGLHSAPGWSFSGSSNNGFAFAGNMNELPVVPKGWRDGDWMCNCGFHNYSSRSQCKECNAPMPSGASSSAVKSAVTGSFTTVGTKRLASEEFVNDWYSKRLHVGDINREFTHPYQGLKELGGSSHDLTSEMYMRYANGNSAAIASSQANLQSPHPTAMPALPGKGAKQWRDGDWMCSNCNNHNFASRTHCNKCKSRKENVESVQ